jgi:hypothetical protein
MTLISLVSLGVIISITIVILSSSDTFQRSYNIIPTKSGHISEFGVRVDRGSVNLNIASVDMRLNYNIFIFRNFLRVMDKRVFKLGMG